MTPDSKARFTDRVPYYVKYRPGYPREVIEFMTDRMGLTPSAIVADIGSGTGILSEMFLANGNLVCGLEPNAEMRASAERSLAAYPDFRSGSGSAESTGLPAHSVDFVVGGQSFHWFDPEEAAGEFRRILKPDGWIAALWNIRKTTTPLGGALEQLFIKHAVDYSRLRHALPEAEIAARVIGAYQVQHFQNSQEFDFEGLQGRILSCSIAPLADQLGYAGMIEDLEAIFEELQVNGKVTLEYDTQLYYGQP